ncbi:MAG: cupin domain-containing protein [Novosphingobium sp.]
MQFASFDIAGFLADYWQKQPLLIRNPWATWENPLSPDELAGLACEDHVESRLISGAHGIARTKWQVEHGPIAETRFGKLGKKPWTLLVQAVDMFVPEVAALIDPFRFIPDWRIDDVMVSYATDQGGVGPHYDQYDVFLIQGAGRRRWQVGGLCDAGTALLPHDDLRLLAEFEVAQEWVLEPGDILYVPPRVAHNGVAEGDDCMTYSIGFRAPSRGELIADWADDLVEQIEDDDRYADPGIARQANPGEITPDALGALHAMVTEKLQDRAAFARWFGGYTTTRKYPDLDFAPDEAMDLADLRNAVASGATLRRNSASRFSFVQQDAATLLFVDGECFECRGEVAAFAKHLCGHQQIELDAVLGGSEAVLELILLLFNQGSVSFEGSD